MADNVDLPPSTGKVATDEVTYSGDTANVQLIRPVLVAGAEGSRTIVDLTGDGTNGLDVDVTRLPAGTNDIGGVVVRRSNFRISVASGGLTIATTAYTAGDQVGTLFTLADAARTSGGSGYITGALLISAADIIGAYDVVIFRETLTLAADNAAFAISDSDALKIVGLIPLSGAYDIGNNRICQASNLMIPYDCNGGTSLFAALITRAGHTFFAAVTDLQLIITVERN